MEKKRSVGVLLVGLYSLFWSAICLRTFILSLGNPYHIDRLFKYEFAPLCILYLLLGYGLFQFKAWGRKATLILMFVSIVFILIQYYLIYFVIGNVPVDIPQYRIAHYITMLKLVAEIAIIIYLMTPKVKELFK